MQRGTMTDSTRQPIVVCGGSNGSAFQAVCRAAATDGSAVPVRVVTRRPAQFSSQPIVAVDGDDRFTVVPTRYNGARDVAAAASFANAAANSAAGAGITAARVSAGFAAPGVPSVEVYSWDELDAALHGASSAWVIGPVHAYQQMLPWLLRAAQQCRGFGAVQEGGGGGGGGGGARKKVCGVIYGQGGIDWMIASRFGGSLPVPGVTLVLLRNFLGIVSRKKGDEVDKDAQVAFCWGRHPHPAECCVIPDDAPARGAASDALLNLYGPTLGVMEQVRSPAGPLLCTIGAVNQLLHPAILLNLMGDVPGYRTYDEPPRAYRDYWAGTCKYLVPLCLEMVRLARAADAALGLEGQLMGNLAWRSNTGRFAQLFTWVANKIGMTTSLSANSNTTTDVVDNFDQLCLEYGAENSPEWFCRFVTYMTFTGNARLRGARVPCVKVSPTVPAPGDACGAKSPYVTQAGGASPGKPQYFPNLESRFIQDDVPFGLAILLGIAEIVGCPMPRTATICARLQRWMGKEYVTGGFDRDGKPSFVLKGRDVMSSGAPQAYGITTLAQLREAVHHHRLPQAHAKM